MYVGKREGRIWMEGVLVEYLFKSREGIEGLDPGGEGGECLMGYSQGVMY